MFNFFRRKPKPEPKPKPTPTPTPTPAPSPSPTPAPSPAPSSSNPSGFAPPTSAPSGYEIDFVEDFDGTTIPAPFNAPYNGTSHAAQDGQWRTNHTVLTPSILNFYAYPDPEGGNLAQNYWVGGGISVNRSYSPGTRIQVCMRQDPYPDLSAICLLYGLANKEGVDEIDFVETSPTSKGPITEFYATAHSSKPQVQSLMNVPGIDVTDWHVWEVEWTESQIIYRVDGAVWASIDNPDTSDAWNSLLQPMFLALQFQTGDPNTPGPDATISAANPIKMQVDWVAAFIAAG